MTQLRVFGVLGFLLAGCGGSETARPATPTQETAEVSPPTNDAGALPPPVTRTPRDRSKEKALARATPAQFSEVICKIAKLNKVQTTAEECSRYKSENGSLGSKTFRRFAERLHMSLDTLTIERGDIDNDGTEEWVLIDQGSKGGSGLSYQTLLGAYRDKGAELEPLAPPNKDQLGSWFYNGNFASLGFAVAGEGTVVHVLSNESGAFPHTFLWKNGRVTQLE